MKPGPQNLITDVAGFRVGNAEDKTIKTGCTVFTADRPFTAAVHVMGGAPGTRETEVLAPDRMVQKVDALFLSGGSAFGLDTGSGVAELLAQRGRGFQVGAVRVPIVPGAILFDLLNGGDKDWVLNPYAELGSVALMQADVRFVLGSSGAGFGATTQDLKGGLGSASFKLASGITVGALVAVNAVGSVVQPESKNFWATPFENGDEFGGFGSAVCAGLQDFDGSKETPGQNTTIAIVATDADLNKAQLTRVATAAHDGVARAIIPSHTPFDGDLIFAASSNIIPIQKGDQDLLEIGHAASLCLSRAIARGVYLANSAAGDTKQTWAEKFR